MSTSTVTSSGAVAVRSQLDLVSEPILRAILQSIEDGVLLTDLDHRSLACNRRFGQMFGIDPAEAVRISVDELRDRVEPAIVDAEGWRASLGRIYADQSARSEDEIAVRLGGERQLRRVSSPVEDADGRIFGRLWTFSDVTEAHRRRRNAELLRAVSLLVDPDPVANLRGICEAVTRHFGSASQINIAEGEYLRFHVNAGELGPAQHLPGLPIRQVYCGYTIEDDRALLVQDARDNPRFSGVLPATVGFCRYLGVPVRDERGKAIGTLCITDQHMDQPLTDVDVEVMEMVALRANAELARERYLVERIAEKDREFARKRAEMEETRLVLGVMNDAFSLLFEVRDRQELLRRLASLLGDVLGYSAAAVFLRCPGEFHYDVALSAQDTHSTRTFITDLDEFPGLEGCDGGAALDLRSVELTGQPLAGLLGVDWAAVACLPAGEWGDAVVVLGRRTPPPLGSARHALGLSALVDGVRLLLAAHALNDGIVQANRALTEAQEKAMRSEKLAVIGTLAASTAHDIRNITASLSMLAAESDDPAESLRSVREQLDRFNVLAHRLLSYARPGQTQLHPIDLSETMDRVLSLTAGQMRVSRVVPTLRVAEGLPTLLGDGHQLQHLFVNLVLNAVQAMERTGGHLLLEADEEGGKVVVRVVDDGPGISGAIVDRLFQPFASSRAQGFGLGLFSARRIAEAHGGTIVASSNPEGGTTMRVELALDGGAR